MNGFKGKLARSNFTSEYTNLYERGKDYYITVRANLIFCAVGLR